MFNFGWRSFAKKYAAAENLNIDFEFKLDQLEFFISCSDLLKFNCEGTSINRIFLFSVKLNSYG